MLKSMTGYGRGTAETILGRCIIDIQSVNRKHLDIQVFLPTELIRFDPDIKKWLSPHISRGQINVRIAFSYISESPFVIRANIPLVRQAKVAWKEIAEEVGKGQEEFQLEWLTNLEKLFIYEENRTEDEDYRQLLHQAFSRALENFLHAKNQEGIVLQKDCLDRLQKIRESIKEIEERVPFATNKYREKLLDRLRELLSGSLENDERILKEVALFAEKIDIAEEVTRFHCHLAHFEEQINASLVSAGKLLEFILQELNREINTIGNKSLDIEISKRVIDIKSELERIREQVQNVE